MKSKRDNQKLIVKRTTIARLTDSDKSRVNAGQEQKETASYPRCCGITSVHVKCNACN